MASRSLYNGITDAKRARAKLGTAGAPDAGAGLLRRQDELIARFTLESSDIQAQIAALQARVGGAHSAATAPAPAADAAGAAGAAGGMGGEDGATMPDEAAAADGDET